MGYRQKHMLDFIKRHVAFYNDASRIFSIARSEKKVALSLEKRGLIKIVNKNWECWQVKIAD